MVKISANTLRALRTTAIVIGAPCIPIAIWYKSAIDDRKKRERDVRTKVRLPNIQTVDDLMIEKCKPGDVILFDRRVEKCAAGPIAAFACLLNRAWLCNDNDDQVRSVEYGKFDHCGIVVPGYIKKRADAFDPSNLLLMEATPGGGIVARPLLTRLEMSQSRSVIHLPLASAGERRNDENYEPNAETKRLRKYVDQQLKTFRDTWVDLSKKNGYKWAHSTLCLAGATTYRLGLREFVNGPVSPSAWLVVLGLNQAAVYQNIDEAAHMNNTKVEDFLRDHRFEEKNSVRLRPGWKFLPPMAMRESSL